MTQDEWNIKRKRLFRQLNERLLKVERKQRPYSYYENKRLEFVSLIDDALKTDWFKMPKETSIIFKIYNNNN